MVPWRACLWFRRNLGSVPLSEGYLEVLGFLILHGSKRKELLIFFFPLEIEDEPVTVSLAGLVVLGRVL